MPNKQEVNWNYEKQRIAALSKSNELIDSIGTNEIEQQFNSGELPMNADQLNEKECET